MKRLDFLYNDIFETIDMSVVFDYNKSEKYNPELFKLMNAFIKDYDEFIINYTPCSRCPFSQERVQIKVYKSVVDNTDFYSVGLKEEIPDYLYRSLSEASLSWNLRVKNYLVRIFHREPVKKSMISIFSFALLVSLTYNSPLIYKLLSIIFFSIIAIFCTFVALRASSFSEFYMDLLSREDYKGTLSFLENFLMKIVRYFIKESAEEFVSNYEEKKINSFSDNIDSIYLEDYRSFRLNLVNLKFNLNQISNKEFVDKAKEGLDIAVELAKYLELHKDKIVYSREFFKTIENLLKLSKISLDNQEYTFGKYKEISLKSIDLANDLVKILSYSFQVILDYDKDELLAKLKVMKMDNKEYLSYLDLKGDKFSNE